MSPAPSVLPGRAYQNTSRKSQLFFHFRAADLALKTVSGDDGTFSRSSVAGRVLQKGLCRTAADAANRLRVGDEGAPQQPSWGYFLNSATGLYEPALVLGRAYTNLVSSDDIDGGWTDVETPVITTGVSDPQGSAGAYRIADNNAGAAEGKYLAVTFTGNAVKAVAFVVREATMPGAGVQRLQLNDETAGASRLDLDISAWVSGEPTVEASTGTLLGTRYMGHGYWLIMGQSTSVTAASTHRLYIYPANTAAQTGSIDVFRANAFNAAVPPPFILSASVARTADSLTFPYLAEPQDITVLVKAFVADLPNMGTARTLFNLGNGDGAAAAIRLYYEAASARLVIAYHNGASEVTGYWTVASLALANTVTVRFHQAGTGAIDAVGLKIDSGAEDITLDGAFASTLALPSAWSSQVIALAGANATANSAPTEVKVAAGSRSTTWMEESY